MPISADDTAAIAELYLAAERQALPAEPIRERYPSLSEEDAYAIQAELLRRKLAAGGVVAGYKAGATNPGAQAAFGLSQAVYGTLLRHTAVVAGGAIERSQLIHPRLECEVAFRMAGDLAGPGVTPAAALAATAGAMAAFEIVDARTVSWGAKMPEMIADNVFAARYLLSETLVPAGGLDLPALSVTLHKNGAQMAQASGANVLGSPANALAWLANRMAEHGRSLRAGDVVLAGSLTPLVPAEAGDTFEASFDRLGALRVVFV
jgi:2-keto-4-pentenoate hydratase